MDDKDPKNTGSMDGIDPKNMGFNG